MKSDKSITENVLTWLQRGSGMFRMKQNLQMINFTKAPITFYNKTL